MNKEIKVSVLVYCYNHGEYIKQCIDSILAQNTSFEYEIIIHDDASKDNSIQIIEEYTRLYPGKIRSYVESSPKFLSNPYMFFYSHMLHLAKGKYIALIESDDFWNDTNKLQKQFEMMERHKECSICVHTVQLLNCINGEIMGVVPYKGIISVKESVIKGEKIVYRWIREGAFFALNSYFIRRNSIEEKDVPKFVLIANGIDFVKVLEAILKGDILFLPEEMGVKRVYNHGSLSQQNKEKSIAEKADTIKKMNQILESFDEYSNYKYHAEVENVILYNKVKILLVLNGQIEEKSIIDFYTGKVVGKYMCYIYAIRNRVKSLLVQNKLIYDFEIKRTKKNLEKRIMILNEQKMF